MKAPDLEPVFGADIHPSAARVLADMHERCRLHAKKLMKDERWVKGATAEALEWAASWASARPVDVTEAA
jgi:hypothetical protein